MQLRLYHTSLVVQRCSPSSCVYTIFRPFPVFVLKLTVILRYWSVGLNSASIMQPTKFLSVLFLAIYAAEAQVIPCAQIHVSMVL